MPARYRRSAYPGRIVRPRRKVVWATSHNTNTVLATTAKITPIDVLAGLEAGGIGITGGTVVRSHIWLSLSHTSADTSPSAISGLIVWDKTNAATTVPDVSSDFYTDWMHLREISPGSVPNAVFVAGTAYLYGMEYDVRARRRLHEMNDSLFFCLQNQGSGNLTYSTFIRTLVMLP